MNDPIERLAYERLYELAVDLHVQLEKGTAMRPVLWMLVQARRKAAAAMVQFTLADPADHAAMRAIQQPIITYDAMVAACRDLVAAGTDAEARIEEEEREEIFNLVSTPEDARALGIEPPPTD